MKPAGVLLLYMGCAKDVTEIRPFLFNIFSDPEIFPLPSFLRIPVAKALSGVRSSLVKGAYKKIGGSPLLSLTFRQAQALKAFLEKQGLKVPVNVGMRYTQPFIKEALEEVIKNGAREIVALTLYPQYCKATVGSCIAALNKAVAYFDQIKTKIVYSWHTHPLFIKCWSNLILDSMKEFDFKNPHIVFCAHNIPERLLKEGDPYPVQIKECARAVMTSLNEKVPYSVAYQSRLKIMRWLKPDIETQIKILASQGIREIIIVPISFVSEHLETLYELDIKIRKLAIQAGIEKFIRVPTPGVHPFLIEAWTELIKEKLESN